MSSRGIIYALYLGFTLLILNIGAYYKSDAYREFIDTLKYGKNFISDEYSPSQTGSKDTQTGGKLPVSNLSQSRIVQSSSGAKLTLPNLTAEEERVLASFNDFSLKRLLVHPSMFDLTTEYPDDYYEYYSTGISLYIFSTKSYREVVGLFEAMATELPFFINKTNSFGTSSFFINVKDEFNDNFVRIIFEYEQKVFGLKIEKKLYNDVKIRLKNLEKASRAKK